MSINCRVSNWTIGMAGNDPVVEIDCHRVHDDGTYDRDPTPIRVAWETWRRVRGVSSYDVVTIAERDMLTED